MIAWGISFGMVVVLHCIPVEAYWDLRVTEKKCINEVAAHMASASLNTLTDFYIFLLPVHTVWSLKLPIRQRIGLVAIFAIGSMYVDMFYLLTNTYPQVANIFRYSVCIAGVVRIWAIKLVFVDSYDNTWEGAVLYIITAIECDLGILCASIPALKPFFTHYFPGLLSASHSTAGGAGNGLSGNKYQLNELSGNGRKVSIGPGCDRRGRSHFAGNGYGPGITVHVQGGYDFDRESTGSSKVSVADSTAESLAGRGVSNRSEDQIIGGARDGGWDASGRGTKRGSDEHEGPGIAIKKQIQVEVEVTSVSPPTIVEFSPMVLNREQARRERERKP